MDFFEYEFSDNVENSSELLDDGILLEHFCGITENMEAAEGAKISEIYGDPIEDSKVWSKASLEQTSAVMCEKYVAQLLTGSEFSEESICEQLADTGAFDENFGCTRDTCGTFLESAGLEITKESGMTMADLCSSIDSGEKVICCVNRLSLYNPELSDFPGMTADHFVEVIGIETSDSQNATIILNDPYGESGATACDAQQFIDSWETSGRYAILAR